MVRKIVDTLLPTTMVGSYPRPACFKHQLLGRDVRVAFKEVQHEEAYTDAVATVASSALVTMAIRRVPWGQAVLGGQTGRAKPATPPR